MCWGEKVDEKQGEEGGPPGCLGTRQPAARVCCLHLRGGACGQVPAFSRRCSGSSLWPLQPPLQLQRHNQKYVLLTKATPGLEVLPEASVSFSEGADSGGLEGTGGCH